MLSSTAKNSEHNIYMFLSAERHCSEKVLNISTGLNCSS